MRTQKSHNQSINFSEDVIVMNKRRETKRGSGKCDTRSTREAKETKQEQIIYHLRGNGYQPGDAVYPFISFVLFASNCIPLEENNLISEIFGAQYFRYEGNRLG